MTLAVAHRGDPRRFRENTLPSLASALNRGADLVEIDLEVTRDGHLVLLHDATLRRLWWRNAHVRELTLAQVREIGRRRGKYRVPGFDEALELIKGTKGGLMVDFGEIELAEPAVEAVARHGLNEQILYVGGPVAMGRVREHAADAHIGLSGDSFARVPDAAVLRDLRPEYINLRWRAYDAASVARCHADGYGVSAWTVDSPRVMRRLMDMGVDMIISNRIGRLLDVRAERQG
ncbi:glycerophosphodiester phosphodiesterase [Embleya scabrispora]|uniref:glycerophosphodiester phosphodiesterase n=1 Tax=Embleya scabrispora TaxID=159449 RepID=UPI00036B6372|nr:glycerophosphodiester phosphodiesterase [Embleya scabrispora]MYS85461.1 glycerophosphodiester phosphodiesterase [Streptomyces sp. SID5474]